MKPTICFAVTNGTIDAETGVVRGVSLITVGPALGHSVQVDQTTLEQVKSAAEKYEGGLKVKLDHNSGAGDIVGFINNLRIEGAKLLGDLHLLDNSPHRDYILEIANKIPETFGLSIAFSGPSELANDKVTVLQRCTEIYSVDIVSEPAANPTGFFSRKMKQLQTESETETETETESPEIEIELPMNEETKKAIAGMIESAMMGMTERLSKLESALPKPEEKAPVAMKAEQEIVQLAAQKAAESALKEFAKTFGAPTAPVVSAEPAPKKEESKKFEDILKAKKDELKGDIAQAMTFCIKNHSNEYLSYRTRVAQGEVIKL